MNLDKVMERLKLTHENAGSLRRFGVSLVGSVPWGTHLCQFYESKQDLIDILVPYFTEGLRSNEFCMWITSPPLEVEEAREALQKAVPDLDEYFKKGQIEITSYNNWYLLEGKFDSNRVLQGWVEKEKLALKRGFEGMRLTGNTFWIERELWNSFVDYEEAINSVVGQHRMIALCTYCLKKCNGTDILDVIRNHAGTLIKQGDKWSLVEDVLHHKKTEEALKVREQDYLSLFSNIMDGFAYCKMLFDQHGKPVDFIYLQINDAFERITGLKRELVVGRKVTEAIPGTEKIHPELLEIYGRVAKTGKNEKFEVFFKPLSLWLSISVYSPQKGYFAAVFEDITERKHAEQELWQAKNDWERTFDAVPDLIAVLDNKHRIVRANRAMAEQLGVTPQQAIGLSCYKCVHGSSLPPEFCPHVKTLQDGKEHIAEVHEPRLGGDFLVSTTPLRDEQGRMIGSVHVARNITERKQNEEKLRKLNRTLRAISNSNQALMRATDEASFLQEACRIIAEDCGYKMVWVGLAEDDEAKSVRPVAYAGFEKGYLDALKITWSDTERGRGPTGRAISTGQPQFCQNMQADPTFKPWREEALKRGYASSIALPLKSGNKVFGALTMYSTEPSACSADEVKLLTELANDFAHGIMMLHLRAEKERSEAEIRKQAALINLSPDGIIVRELEGTITFWSKGAEKLYGWTKEEATGQSAHKLLKTKFPEPYESIIAKLKQTGKWSGELIHTAKTGRRLTVQSWWQPKLDQHGEIVELMESNVDITERNKAENELRETRDYLESLLNYANAPVIVWDPQFRITLFNHAFERLTGLNAYDVIEKPLEILFPEDKKGEAMAHIKRTLEGEYWETVEIPILDVDGNVKTVLWNSANIYDPNGKAIVATIAQGHDITVRKQMEKKLEEYSKHLEQLVEERTKQLRDSERLATIGATAGMVGHDIRNPLQAIIGDIFLAKTDLSSLTDSEQKTSVQESLFEIEKNVEYINKIVADLQDFAKPLNPTVMEIDLKRIIDEVVSNRRIPGNIQAFIKVEKNAERIVADSAYVQRILSNLVNNAVQAMPNGGKLTVHSYCEGKDNVITVEDTGVGIPEEAKSKLFTPLFTTKPKGQGFGLAVVKRMTEALGGTVTFESQADNGTKFIVRLPKRTNGKQASK